MASTHRHIRELAERSSNGTRVRLLWRQGTSEVWVEVREPEEERALAIVVPPEQALDAFHHPYAYAGSHRPLLPVESLKPRERRLQGADEEHGDR